MASNTMTQDNVDSIVVQQRPGSSFTDRLRVYRSATAVHVTVYGYDRKRNAAGQAQIRLPLEKVAELVSFLEKEHVSDDSEE